MVVPAANRGHPHRSFSKTSLLPVLDLFLICSSFCWFCRFVCYHWCWAWPLGKVTCLTRTETWVGCMTLWGSLLALLRAQRAWQSKRHQLFLLSWDRGTTHTEGKCQYTRRDGIRSITCPSHCHLHPPSFSWSPGTVALRFFPRFALDVSTVMDAVRACLPARSGRFFSSVVRVRCFTFLKYPALLSSRLALAAMLFASRRPEGAAFASAPRCVYLQSCTPPYQTPQITLSQ